MEVLFAAQNVMGVDGSKTVAAGSSKVVVSEVVVGEDVVGGTAIPARYQCP